jgi:hypothetical protein
VHAYATSLLLTGCREQMTVDTHLAVLATVALYVILCIEVCVPSPM